MFEDSLLTSGNNAGRSRRSGIVALSLGLQAVTVAVFLILPLFFPATLPVNAMTPKITSITLLKKPEIKPQPKPQVLHASTSGAISAPNRTVYVEQTHGGSMARPTSTPIGDDPPAVMTGNGMVGATSIVGIGLSPSGSGTSVTARVPAAPKDDRPVRISGGVMAGRLLQPIQATYPRLAIATHTEGIVMVTATIDKQGRIAGLQVLSGPPMLRTAAVDAVKEARYKAFLLNGEPTEVTTTITVNFRIGG